MIQFDWRFDSIWKLFLNQVLMKKKKADKKTHY